MRRLVLVGALLAIAACDPAPPQDTPQAGTAERERRDSVLGASRLPGAGVVQRADALRDTSRSRAAAIDSLRD